jgi:hypothetical protein
MKQPDFDLGQGWWYPAILGSVLFLIVLLMPKVRINWKEIYITFGIIGYIVWMIDTTIAVPFDIFDINHPKKTGLSEIILYGVIPSCLSIIYLNLYKREKKWTLVTFFVIISFILEWLTSKVGVMKGAWQIWWSIPIFLVAYAFFLPWHLKFIRKKWN